MGKDYQMQRVDEKLFSLLMGRPDERLPAGCIDYLKGKDFSFRDIDGEERDKVLLEVLRKVTAEENLPVGPLRQEQWEAGWEENLRLLQATPDDLSVLDPKYYRGNTIIRLNQKYVRVANQSYEYDLFRLLREWVTEVVLRPWAVSALYEFGCGPGHNLVHFANKLPGIRVWGLDWAAASQRIIELLHARHFPAISGRHFDFFHPDENFALASNSVVVTFGGLEQVGAAFDPFVRYLIHQKPSMVVHVEPIIELYDPSVLEDYLAILYHKKRGYLDGYLTFLKKAREESVIKSLTWQRVPVGGKFHEGWNIIVWKP